jgi:hypothetical protein
MNTPNSRQPVWHRVARIALSIMQVLMPMSAGILDKKQARYWQALPLRRMAALLAALFLVVGAWGFFLDLTEWKRLPLWALLLYSSLFGTAGVVFFIVIRRRVVKLIPLFVILVTAIVYVPRWLPHGPHIPVSDPARARIALDAICIMASTLLGYRLFLLFINTQGLEQVRTRAELDLAYGMQQMLVPPITYRTECFEVYGLKLSQRRSRRRPGGSDSDGVRLDRLPGRRFGSWYTSQPFDGKSENRFALWFCARPISFARDRSGRQGFA